MVGAQKGDLGAKPLNPINNAEREKKNGAMPQVGHEDALRDGALRRWRVEQISRHAREIGCICQGGVPKGAVLRANVQGRYSGQGRVCQNSFFENMNL